MLFIKSDFPGGVHLAWHPGYWRQQGWGCHYLSDQASESTSSFLLSPARGHTNRIRVRVPSNYIIATLGLGFGSVLAVGNRSRCSALLHRVRLPLNTQNSHDLNSLLTFQCVWHRAATSAFISKVGHVCPNVFIDMLKIWVYNKNSKLNLFNQDKCCNI